MAQRRQVESLKSKQEKRKYRTTSMNATVTGLALAVCQLMDNDSRQVYIQKFSRLRTHTMLLVTS